MKKITGCVNFDYKKCGEIITELKNTYPELQVNECGKSLLGKRIYTLTVGSGSKKVLFVAATHGSEYITAPVLLKFVENLLYEAENGGTVCGYDAARLLRECTLVCVPLLNPDGADIAVHGENACGKYRDICIEACGGDFLRWNANARGVDINHNFDAGWALAKEGERLSGVNAPSAGKFGGEYPESEPETAALTRLCRAVLFRRMLSFHSQGGEIYWHYGKNTPSTAENTAKILSAVSGYELKDNSGSASHGGFKDWFIDELHREAFTVEVGSGENPLPLWQIDGIYECVSKIMLYSLIL